jgi:hypothetical protein
MKRQTFLKILGGAPAFLASFLWAKNPPQDVDKKTLTTAEPIDALDKILCQLAQEFNTKVESCTGEGHSHSRTIKAVKLPKQFNSEDWWLCLHTQTNHQDGLIEDDRCEHFTRATLCVESHNPISENTQIWLANYTQSGGSGCGGGGFGIDIGVRTCTKKTGKIEWISTDVDMRRRLFYENNIHPLHKRVIALFEQLTYG